MHSYCMHVPEFNFIVAALVAAAVVVGVGMVMASVVVSGVVVVGVMQIGSSSSTILQERKIQEFSYLNIVVISGLGLYFRNNYSTCVYIECFHHAS